MSRISWAEHLTEMGHGVDYTVDVVDEFDGGANIVYDATDSQNACGGELLCESNETDVGDIKVTTELIESEDHEIVMAVYYEWYQRLSNDDAPPECQFENDPESDG